jgi:hypothetical protein
LARIEIPEAHRTIVSGARKLFSFRPKSYRTERAGVPVQRVQAPTSVYLPDLDGRVIATAYYISPIRAKSKRSDPILVFMELLNTFSRINIPDPYLLIIAASR